MDSLVGIETQQINVPTRMQILETTGMMQFDLQYLAQHLPRNAQSLRHGSCKPSNNALMLLRSTKLTNETPIATLRQLHDGIIMAACNRIAASDANQTLLQPSRSTT